MESKDLYYGSLHLWSSSLLSSALTHGLLFPLSVLIFLPAHPRLPLPLFIMATTNDFPASDVNAYDYVIVGGGTAGCVIASRLAQYLPNKRILLIEAGPSDYMDDRVLNLKEWLNLLGGELDYDYPTVEQPMGRLPLETSGSRW